LYVIFAQQEEGALDTKSRNKKAGIPKFGRKLIEVNHKNTSISEKSVKQAASDSSLRKKKNVKILGSNEGDGGEEASVKSRGAGSR
jgi:hypothetical protein